jgi:Rieske Fe-S protein
MRLFRNTPTHMGVAVLPPEQSIPVLPHIDLDCVTIQCHGSEFDMIGKLHNVIVGEHAFIGLQAVGKTPVDWTTGLMIVTCKCSDYFELSEDELMRVPK